MIRGPGEYQSSSKLPIGWLLAGAAWLLATVSMMVLLLHYSKIAGNSGSPPSQWPPSSAVALDPGRPTLVMFAHPRCPCTRASLGELELLIARCQGRLLAHVIFLRPEGTDDKWLQTDLWRTASAIPGVTVHGDVSGAEAGRFHCETSGHTLLYGNDGKLMFQGGITGSRGHSGDNPGRTALVALLENHQAAKVTTAVFGCPLVADQSCSGGVVCTR